jgi:hypothetical protein
MTSLLAVLAEEQTGRLEESLELLDERRRV